ncbi:MAG TPA: hypothetical protein VK327_01235 [Candidatus Paceibacterota bacterium]|nr:hypothetical protein [Candidatus Paceibacterota bacterium]
MSNQPPKNTERQFDLPPAGEVALVQGKGFRCMAYRDKDGKWRDYVHRNELPEPIAVINTIQS